VRKENREYYAANRDKILEKQRNYYHKVRSNREKELRDKLFGSSCAICGSSLKAKSLPIHEKNGLNHLEREALKRPEDFVRLCIICHKGVHWCMEQFGMSWDDILEHLINRRKYGSCSVLAAGMSELPRLKASANK
jgi:predicted HNH restriction endonuclease